MNTHMYSHPLTSKQLEFVKEELGYRVEGPIPKKLACGDIGALSSRSSRSGTCADVGIVYRNGSDGRMVRYRQAGSR